MEIKFIRLAHEMGLGCGDPREIEIVGDQEAGREQWDFVGPFKKMTFASRMQHKIYWGPLKKPIEWTLKTVLAPWAYIASVIYHDSFWYPFKAKKQMASVLESRWGRLFRDWENLQSDEQGFSAVGDQPAELKRTGLAAFGHRSRSSGPVSRKPLRSLNVGGCRLRPRSRPRMLNRLFTLAIVLVVAYWILTKAVPYLRDQSVSSPASLESSVDSAAGRCVDRALQANEPSDRRGPQLRSAPRRCGWVVGRRLGDRE